MILQRKSNNNIEYKEVKVGYLVNILRFNIAMILTVSILLGGLGFGFGTLKANNGDYIAYNTILIKASDSIMDRIAEIEGKIAKGDRDILVTVEPSVSEIMGNYLQSFNSISFYESISKQVGDIEIDILKNMIKIQNISGTDYIEIEVTGDEEEQVLNIAKAVNNEVVEKLSLMGEEYEAIIIDEPYVTEQEGLLDRVKAYILIGIGVGFIIAYVYCFVRAWSKKSINYVDDILDNVDAPVIGIIYDKNYERQLQDIKTSIKILCKDNKNIAFSAIDNQDEKLYDSLKNSFNNINISKINCKTEEILYLKERYDGIIISVEAGKTSWENLYAIENNIKQLNSKVFGYIINNFDERKIGNYKYLIK